MAASHSSLLRNVLLSKLEPEELAKFSRDLVTIDLPKNFLIATSNGPIEHVYFPDSGIGSIVAVSPEGNKAEAGIFGREGFSPVQAAVGAGFSPHEIVMQGAGSGHRIAYASFLQAMENSRSFAHLVACYSQALAIQVTYTALSNVSHTVDERIRHAVGMMKLLRDAARDFGKTVVVVLHDVNFASCYSDHIIVMRDGRLFLQGTPQEIIRPEVLEQTYGCSFRVHELGGDRIAVYYA